MSKSQHKKSVSRKKSPKRNKKFVSYDDARHIVQRHQIQSRKQYWDWLYSEGIAYLPTQPPTTYKDSWVSWNEFLGVANDFESTTRQEMQYRSYWDAVRWSQAAAHENKLLTFNDWMEYYEGGNVPADIPKRPDAYYEEWKGRGWGTWLGTTIEGKIMTEKEAQQIMALIVQKGHAKNVVTVKVEKGGMSALEQAWIDAKEAGQEFQVLRTYDYKPTDYNSIQGVLEMVSTPYQGSDNIRLVENLPTMLWELDSILEIVK